MSEASSERRNPEAIRASRLTKPDRYRSLLDSAIALAEPLLSRKWPNETSENGGVSTLAATQSNPALLQRCYDLNLSGSATPDIDYSLSDDDPAAGLQVCVEGSELQATLTLTGIDDNLFEDDESVQLSAPGVASGLTLLDDETLPQIIDFSFDRSAFSEVGGEALLQLELSHPWQDPRCIEVSYSGTATLDIDYISEDQAAATPGVQLCLPAAGTEGNLIVAGVDDSETEGKEQVVAEISEPAAASASVLIGDDESAVPLFEDGFEDPLPPQPE